MRKIKKPFLRRLILFSFIILFGLTTICFTSLDLKAYTADINTYPLNGENVSLHIPVKSNTNINLGIRAEGSDFQLGYILNGNLYIVSYPTNSTPNSILVGYLEDFYVMFFVNYTTSIENGVTYYDIYYGFVYYSVVDSNYLILNQNVFVSGESLLVGVTSNNVSIYVEGSQIFIDTGGTFLIADFGFTNIIDSASRSIEFIKTNFDLFLNYSYDSGYAKGYNDGVLGGDATSFIDFGTVILEMVNNFLSFEILPNFSLLNVLHLCLAIGFVFVILRFFAGG